MKSPEQSKPAHPSRGDAPAPSSPGGCTPPFVLDRKLTAEEINTLDRLVYSGPLHWIRSHKEMLKAVHEMKRETLLGFDTEKRPSFRRGVVYSPALLQLAGRDAVWIFQLRETGLPAELTDILSDAAIIKAGVAVGRDLKELRELTAFEPRGFVDLGLCAMHSGIQHHGLRGLVALLLGRRLSKGARLTNWESPDLSKAALVYAATDAWVGRRIYLAMQERGCALKPLHATMEKNGQLLLKY